MTLQEQRVHPGIYFHHIAKTAGTSLRNFLVSRAGDANVAPMLRTGRLREALRDYARFAVITGHLDALPGDRLPADRVSITLLREPIDRVISGFYFQKHVYKAGRRGADGDTSDFASWLASLEGRDIDALNGHVASLWPLGWSGTTEPSASERIAAAQRALDGFDVVGMQSSMAESLALLSCRLGWVPPDDAPHANRTPGRLSRGDLSAAVIRRLEQMLAPDLAVYEHARSVFRRHRLTTLRKAARVNAGCATPDHSETGAGAAEFDNLPADARTIDGAPDDLTGQQVALATRARGTRGLYIEGVAIKGEISEAEYLQVGESAILGFRVVASVAVTDLNVGFAIRDAVDALVFATNTRSLSENVALTPGAYAVAFRFHNELGIGHYRVSVSLHHGNSHLDGYLHHIDHACQFDVVDRLTEYFEGRVRLRVSASVTAIGEGSHAEVTPIEAPGHERFALLAHRNPALTEFSARLVPLVPLPPLRRAADAMIHFDITNSGSLVWGAFGKRAVTVSYHWLDAARQPVVREGLRTSLPHDIKPGERVELACFLRAPEVAGRMTLVWTLVQENVAWFNDKNGQSSFECEVDIA